MNIRYKLTDQDLNTYHWTHWYLNEWKETSGLEDKLCTSSWLHCYTSPLLAILLNPIHADIINPKLFKCEVEGKCLTDKGLKEGWTRMRIIEEMEVPQLSNINKIAFGILCALEVCKEEKFVKWANNWLDGSDRTEYSLRRLHSNSRIKHHILNAAYYYSCDAADPSYPVADPSYPVASSCYYSLYYSLKENNFYGYLIKLAEKCLEYK